jgi:23S rRNA (cytidine1920-2'-O)/16S rRNA (cytidine1409-2'-O)-methyltransferase
VVADVSFISLLLLMERMFAVTASAGRALLMVKPQFEVGRELLGKGGVVRSPALHREVVARIVEAAGQLGWHAQRVARSRWPGPAGNVEYFVLFATAPPEVGPDLDTAVQPAQS